MRSCITKSLLAIAAVFAINVNYAHADIIASESFDTLTPGVGALVGQGSSDPGFTGNFFSNGGNSHTVDAVGLSIADPLYIGSSGGAIRAPSNQGGRNAILLANPVTDSTNNETLYVSFLLEIESVDGANSYRAFELHDTTLGNGSNGLADSPNRQFQLGFHNGDFGTSNFGFRAANDNAFQGDLGVVRNTNTNLFVLEFDLSDTAGGDSVTAFINPTLGAGVPLTGGVTQTGFDITFDTFTLARFGGSDIILDEVRFGTTFDSVTIAAVPEPGSLGLLGAACVGLFVRRRRR